MVLVCRFRQSTEASSAQGTYKTEESKVEKDSDNEYGGKGRAQDCGSGGTQKEAERFGVLATRRHKSLIQGAVQCRR